MKFTVTFSRVLYDSYDGKCGGGESGSAKKSAKTFLYLQEKVYVYSTDMQIWMRFFFFIGEGIISLNVISNSKQTHLLLIVAKASDGQQYLLPLSVCKMWRWEGQERSWWPMLGLYLSTEAGTWAMTLDWSRLAGVGALGLGSQPRGWLELELRGWNQSLESRIGTLRLGLGPQG